MVIDFKPVDNSEKETIPDPGEVKETASGGIRIGRSRITATNKKTTQSSTNASSTAPTATTASSDLERLRSAIQSLVQNTGPLGTCMDFILEDVGLMASELNRWEEECRKYEMELEADKRKTENILKPLQLELIDLDQQVKEKIAKISAMKANIAQNEARIQQQLKLVATT